VIGFGDGLISGVTSGASVQLAQGGIWPRRRPHIHRMVPCRDLPCSALAPNGAMVADAAATMGTGDRWVWTIGVISAGTRASGFCWRVR